MTRTRSLGIGLLAIALIAAVLALGFTQGSSRRSLPEPISLEGPAGRSNDQPDAAPVTGAPPPSPPALDEPAPPATTPAAPPRPQAAAPAPPPRPAAAPTPVTGARRAPALAPLPAGGGDDDDDRAPAGDDDDADGDDD